MITCSKTTGYERDVLVFKNEHGVRLEVPGEYMSHGLKVIEHRGDIYALPTDKNATHSLLLREPVLAVKTRVVYPRGGAIARTKG